MKFCLSQMSTLSTAFAEDLQGYADGGCQAVEVWLTKLETHLEQFSVGETQQLIQHLGIQFSAASYQGGLFLSQGEARQAAFDLLKRRLDLCQTFQIPTMVLVGDFAQKVDPTSLGRAVFSLIEAAHWASAFDVSLALEFRGTDMFCTCLDTALMLLAECQEPNVGLCLDVFHYFKGPSKAEDLERLTKDNLKHVQLCDVAGIPRELMTDLDRVFPGEGDFRLAPILQRLKEIDYDGWLSLELMNPILWEAKPSQVAELGLTAMQRLIS